LLKCDHAVAGVTTASADADERASTAAIRTAAADRGGRHVCRNGLGEDPAPAGE